ncbi:hypothetical protein [Salinispora cortesiana]|uniref:hypothetical protein n=1 Tax=Salinispora cortesiana TaxID=1305843 RepID=UPI000400F59F|nr:hypothetical protein [Salinispora cortesiana]
MLLGKGNAGQWDVLYDYNTVATTVLQAGGSTRASRSGVAVRYPQATTMASPVELRMQLMNGNGVWRRPYLGETGTAEPKTCETPPRYEDWIYDKVNIPPNCFTASYTTRAGEVTGDPVQLDSFTVGKPATITTFSADSPFFPRSRSAAGVHNGVDQQALAACLDSASSNCIDQVPGLAACVAARAVCNITGRESRQIEKLTPMTARGAIKAAASTFDVVDAAPSTVTTEAQPASFLTAGVPSEGPVHVVSSTARVRSMAVSHDQVYKGYVAVFEAASGRMISACLGAGCQEAW